MCLCSRGYKHIFFALFLIFFGFIKILKNMYFRISKELTNLTQNRQSKYWNINTGYSKTLDFKYREQAFPYRTFSAGPTSSLRVILKIVNRNIDHLCTGPTRGFKVAFHAPFEVPQVWKKYYHVAPKQSIDFLISPKVMTASSGLSSLSSEIRKCFFDSERSLKYFKVYTQQNCALECLSNFTASLCGCVKFSMASELNIY